MKKTVLAFAISTLFNQVAAANGVTVDDVKQGYSVVPTAVQSMYDEIAQNYELLQKINLVPKTEKTGEVIGLSVGLIAGNTDTNSNEERKTRSIHSLTGRKYVLEQTDFDTHLKYSEIDQWAHIAPTFPARVNKKVAEAIGLSMICVGLNGTKRAATTDPVSNPLLQDVAKGWLQKMREENSARVLGSASQPVQYGAGASEYKNLDAVVEDVMNEMLDERFAGRTDYVVLAARKTIGDKYLKVVNASGDKATELEASGRLTAKRTVGNLPVIYVPHMPENTLLITPLENLSIYYQPSAERRTIVDNPKKNRLESYQSKNIDFIVEEYGAAILVEHLKAV